MQSHVPSELSVEPSVEISGAGTGFAKPCIMPIPMKPFIGIGCDTAESIMSLSRDELIRRTDLEEETVDAMIAAVKEELAK